jgi:hypothetical protein
MAGLQEAAAVVGILELSFRSICTLYDFLKELKEVPQQIERLLSEVTALKNILAALEYLQRADLRTQAIIARFDTPAALGNCAHSCAILQSDIRKWTRSGHHSLRAKVQVRWHKKSIEARVSHIAETKQTTLLSIAALQLYVHRCAIYRRMLTSMSEHYIFPERWVINAGPCRSTSMRTVKESMHLMRARTDPSWYPATQTVLLLTGAAAPVVTLLLLQKGPDAPAMILYLLQITLNTPKPILPLDPFRPLTFVKTNGMSKQKAKA